MYTLISWQKYEKTWTTIGAPHKLYSSTLVNFVSNGQRNTWVKAGREADTEHKSRPIKRQRASRANLHSATRATTNDTGTSSTAADSQKNHNKTGPSEFYLHDILWITGLTF